MSPFAQFLEPPARFMPGLIAGTLKINWAANRVIDAGSGEFVGALVPGSGLVSRLAGLPLDPVQAASALANAVQLQQIQGLLQKMQLVTSVGAIASVAGVGVSLVGFGLVINRLSKMDGKLDESLRRLEVLQQSVEDLHVRSDALSVARMRSAGDSLDRALMAEHGDTRRELASRARDLFQESRNLYLELWRRSDPFSQLSVDVDTAMEMQGRYVACAIGEIQAEFVRGDMGAFRHAVQTAAEQYQENMMLDAPEALRARSDQACGPDVAVLARLSGDLPRITGQLERAFDTTRHTLRRLKAYELDAELPGKLGLDPHEVAQTVRLAVEETVYVLLPATPR